MKQKFIKNIIFLIFLNLLIKPIWIFGIDRTIQNTVGVEEYGFYFALFNFSMLFNIFLDFGITNFNNRNISQNSSLLSKHLSNITVLKFMLGILYMLISLLTGFIIGYRSQEISFLFFLGINQFLLSLILYFRSNIAALQLFKTDSIISIIDRLLLIIICIFLLSSHNIFGKFSIEQLIFAQGISYLITALIAGFIIISKSKFIKLKFDLIFIIAILKKSLPFALLVLLMTSYTRIDSIMLERLLPDGSTQAGIYAQGFRILDAVIILAYLFASLLLPMFSKMIKEKENVEQLTKTAFLLLIIPTFIITISAFFYSDQIMSLLYIEEIKFSAPTFKILILCFLPISISYIFGTLLTANGSLKALNITAGISVILNITLNYFFILKYNALGAATASLITQSFSAIIQVMIAIKIFNLKINKLMILKLVVFVGLTISFVFSIYIYIEIKEIGFLLSLISGAGLGFSLKLIDLKSIFTMYR